MKRWLTLLLAFCFTLLSCTGCQIDNYTDQSDWNCGPGEMVDDKGYSGTPSDYEEEMHALSQGDLQIPGRSSLARFNITNSYFIKCYNDLNPKHPIVHTSYSENYRQTIGYKLAQCLTDGPYTIYIRSDNEISYVYFSYPVKDTQNGAWDYEEDINLLFSIFDTAMPTLYDENDKLTLEYLSEWMDVSCKDQNLDPLYLEILRKYMNMTFEINDGIAYVGIGTIWFKVEDNFSTYF